MDIQINRISQVLQSFQDGYTARDLSRLDEFMQLFLPGGDVELIGTGASAPGKDEWCRGTEQVREIIASDWKYWGDVRLDVSNARISVMGDVAWLSTGGEVLQTASLFNDQATEFSLKKLGKIVEDETLSPKARLLEAAHFSVRRWREREMPPGHPWPFAFTAVLIEQQGHWCFHTIHWSMPVE